MKICTIFRELTLLAAMLTATAACGSTDNSQPPAIYLPPEIGQLNSQNNLKASITENESSFDPEDFCETVARGTYISETGDCNRLLGKSEFACPSEELYYGECDRGVLIPGGTNDNWGISVFGLPKKPTQNTVNLLSLLNDANLETDYYVLQFNNQQNTWRLRPSTAELPLLRYYDKTANNGLIIYSKQAKFLPFNQDYTGNSYDQVLNPGWNLISTNVSKRILAAEYFSADLLEAIHTIWIYNEDLVPVNIYGNQNRLNSTYLRPNEGFWVNAKSELVIKANNQFNSTTEECSASCAGRECGDDGCGGSCGLCAETEVCSLEGDCEAKAEEQSSEACSPLELVTGEIVEVDSLDGLKSAVENFNQQNAGTILLADGVYTLDNSLVITGANITIRSKSGNRDDVLIKGRGMTGSVPHIFLVRANNFTLANLALGEVKNHAVQVQGEEPHNADNFTLHNVRVFNTGEQMIKGSTDNSAGADNGQITCSTFEYSANYGPQYYIGGIDVHRGENWQVAHNTFKNIRSPEAGRVAEHAIHFWNASKNVEIFNNTIVNSDRGIGLGLGNQGFDGGLVYNNFIFNNGEGLNDDVGIALESASNVDLVHNTIFLQGSYLNAIEYRFADSQNNRIYNNLTNKQITARDSGEAELKNNYQNAEEDWFYGPENGDLRLTTFISEVVDQGLRINLVTEDIEGDSRQRGDNPDIGADELHL
jgi:hypothetical protein